MGSKANFAAKVTLTALNGQHQPSERDLTLEDDKPIQIGRASKNSTKGLSGAKDNAWFDSPVMSRNHAQISFNPINRTITIEDIGSMHGTYLNNSQLKTNERQILSDNDILVFGAEVKRGDDTFPACAFRINYATNTFSCPDSSDIEDEECEISDNELGENESPFSEDDISIESQPFNSSHSINAIDLTGDDSPAAYSTEGEVEEGRYVGKHFMGVVNDHFGDRNQNVDGAVNSGHVPIIVDSDEDDENLSSGSDNHYDDMESDEPSLRDPYESDEVGDSEDGDCIEVGNTNSLFHAGPNSSANEAKNDQIEPLWNKALPSLDVRTLIEVSEQIVGEEDNENSDYDEDVDADERDFGISNAGRDSLQKLRDDGLLDKISATNPFVKVGKDIVVVGESLSKTTTSNEIPGAGEEKNVTFASLCWEISPEKNAPVSFSAESHFDYTSIPSSAPVKDQSVVPSVNLRQPSPSDAAMAKSALPPSSFGVRVDHLPSEEWQQLTTQSLGDKTGKHEFFAARLHNRTTLNSGNKDEVTLAPPALQSTISTPESTYQELKRQRSIQATNKFKERRSAATKDLITLPSDSKIPTAVPFPAIPYLDDHAAQVPLPERSPSPEFDMTSAVKYNESKITMGAANKSPALFSGRSGLSINDIIDDSSSDQKPKDLKRKAEDISDAIQNDVRNWASSRTLDVSVGSTGMTAVASETGILQQDEGIPNIADIPEHRPVKKLRRFVERLGYAALGGAAVGAGLFSALVATAPDFM